MRRLTLWAPPALYMGLIYFLSSQSSFPVPAGIWSFDKLIHCVEYGVLAFLLMRGFLGAGVALGQAAALSLLIASLYGVSDEIHQAYVPGRSSSPYDVLADVLGAAAVVFFWFQKERRR